MKKYKKEQNKKEEKEVKIIYIDQTLIYIIIAAVLSALCFLFVPFNIPFKALVGIYTASFVLLFPISNWYINDKNTDPSGTEDPMTKKSLKNFYIGKLDDLAKRFLGVSLIALVGFYSYVYTPRISSWICLPFLAVFIFIEFKDLKFQYNFKKDMNKLKKKYSSQEKVFEALEEEEEFEDKDKNNNKKLE